MHSARCHSLMLTPWTRLNPLNAVKVGSASFSEHQLTVRCNMRSFVLWSSKSVSGTESQATNVVSLIALIERRQRLILATLPVTNRFIDVCCYDSDFRGKDRMTFCRTKVTLNFQFHRQSRRKRVRVECDENIDVRNSHEEFLRCFWRARHLVDRGRIQRAASSPSGVDGTEQLMETMCRHCIHVLAVHDERLKFFRHKLELSLIWNQLRVS